jgi:hypothetical protein
VKPVIERGHVRNVNISRSPGQKDYCRVEVWLTDLSNHEQYYQWTAPHFEDRRSPAIPEIRPGDDLELRIATDTRRRYTRQSYVHNHSRDVHYTLRQRGLGCLGLLAASSLPIVAGAAIALLF